MKILFLSYNGLLEPILPSQAVPYLKGLAKKGHEFILLTYEKKKDLDTVGDAGLRRVREDLAVSKIDWRYLRYHKTPPLLSTLFDLFVGAFSVFSIIKKEQVKIVHVRGITPGIIMLMLSKALKVKMLFDMRGLLAEEYVGGGMWEDGGIAFRLVKKAEKRMLMTADAITVLTRKHLDLNRSLAYLAKRDIPMEVVPCCVDTSKFDLNKAERDRLREDLGIKDKFVLMYPGKIGTFYLTDEMIEFFKYMTTVIPETIFFIITNDDPGRFLDRAGLLNAEPDKIAIKQKVSYEEMPRYMRIADAGIFFINPYKKFGSSPIKMGEFLASGVPVIINPGIGDTEELVRENGVGAVVSKFDEKDYRGAIGELMALRKDGDALRRRCRETAVRNLSADEAISKYAGIYEILSKQAPEK